MPSYPHHMTLKKTPHAPTTEGHGLVDTVEKHDVVRRARDFAFKAHGDQTDKQGFPYIDHLRRVKDRVEYLGSPEMMAVAYLHDVMEDTPTSPHDLRAAGFSEGVIEAVVFLSHEDDEDYYRYIEDIRSGPSGAARVVKLADLDDHLSHVYPEMKLSKIEQYLRAYRMLAGVDHGYLETYEKLKQEAGQ